MNSLIFILIVLSKIICKLHELYRGKVHCRNEGGTDKTKVYSRGTAGKKVWELAGKKVWELLT
jgi:hypothetical protein